MDATEYKLLNNKELWTIISRLTSGAESARLWILDSWEVDHDRQGLLSDKNLDRLQTAIRRLPVREREIYDAWNYAYRLLDYTLMETKITALEIGLESYKALASAHLLDSKEANALAGKVAKFKAEQSILLALGLKTGLPIGEDLGPLEEEVLGFLQALGQIDYGKVKPDEAEIGYLHERLSMALGDTWMEKEGLNG